MIHLTVQQLSSQLDADLPQGSSDLVRRHLEGCPECTLRYAALRAQEDVLASALVHNPEDDFFERFPAALERRIEGGTRGATSGPTAVEARPPIAAAALPPTAVERAPEAGTERPQHPHEPNPRRGRATDPHPPHAAQWLAALTLAVIAGAVGVVVSRPHRTPGSPEAPPAARPESAASVTIGPVASITPAVEPVGPGPSASDPTPEPAVQAPKPPAPPRSRGAAEAVGRRKAETSATRPSGENFLVVRRIVAVTETTAVRPPETSTPTPAGGAGSRVATPGLLATAPDPLRPAIRTAELAAAADPTAANFDAVADAWQHTIPSLAGTPRQTAVRQRIAEARVRAWEAAPDAYRAASAKAALRSYLVFAPPGAARDTARAWLARLGR